MTKFFDAKAFNEQAFGSYMDAMPDLKRNALLNSGAIVGNERLKSLLQDQTGSYLATIPFYGNLDQTEPDNFDGQTDLTADTTTTFTQTAFAYGRAKGWTEKSFSKEITAGADFMANIRKKIGKYWNNVDQDTILAVLEALFGLTDTAGKAFADAHSTDISEEGDGMMTATTLNNATQKACGQNKGQFGLVITHSQVATNLENKQLLEYFKYNTAEGMQRDLTMYYWNGKLVIVDDSMPVEVVEATETDPAYSKYTTYILGNGAITMQPLPVDHAYEMTRDAKTNGGMDTLYTRRRYAIAVDGFSWTNKSVATLSPTRAEIAMPANWELINDGNTTASKRKYYDHQAIAIAKIVSKG